MTSIKKTLKECVIDIIDMANYLKKHKFVLDIRDNEIIIHNTTKSKVEKVLDKYNENVDIYLGIQVVGVEQTKKVYIRKKFQ